MDLAFASLEPVLVVLADSSVRLYDCTELGQCLTAADVLADYPGHTLGRVPDSRKSKLEPEYQLKPGTTYYLAQKPSQPAVKPWTALVLPESPVECQPGAGFQYPPTSPCPSAKTISMIRSTSVSTTDSSQPEDLEQPPAHNTLRGLYTPCDVPGSCDPDTSHPQSVQALLPQRNPHQWGPAGLQPTQLTSPDGSSAALFHCRTAGSPKPPLCVRIPSPSMRPPTPDSYATQNTAGLLSPRALKPKFSPHHVGLQHLGKRNCSVPYRSQISPAQQRTAQYNSILHELAEMEVEDVREPNLQHRSGDSSQASSPSQGMASPSTNIGGRVKAALSKMGGLRKLVRRSTTENEKHAHSSLPPASKPRRELLRYPSGAPRSAHELYRCTTEFGPDAPAFLDHEEDVAVEAQGGQRKSIAVETRTEEAAWNWAPSNAIFYSTPFNKSPEAAMAMDVTEIVWH